MSDLLAHLTIPVDGSDRSLLAIPYALRLARPGSHLTILEVVPSSHGFRDTLGRMGGEEQVVQTLNKQARDHPEQAARSVRGLDQQIGLDLRTASGEPAEAILEMAGETGVSMLLMVSSGRGALGRLAYGSVADRVARTSTLPVLMIHGSHAGDPADSWPKRIVVPLDGPELAREALPVAAHLGKVLGVPLVLLTVVDPTIGSPVTVAYAAAFSEKVYQDLLDEALTRAGTMLVEQQAALATEGVEAHPEIRSGSPARAIVDALKPGDLIVMTSHGRGGMERWLIGSTAEKLLREGPVPVLLIRPAPGGRSISSG